MGLDMNFYKSTYIGNQWKEEKIEIDIPGVNGDRVTEVIEEVGYLRKANAIHNWIVENCADGADECQRIDLSHEKIRELLDLVYTVLKSMKLVDGKITNGYRFENGKETPILEDGKTVENSNVAEELLPTGNGFFFGSTAYDEYYVADLEETKKILEDMLKDQHGNYYYRASW